MGDGIKLGQIAGVVAAGMLAFAGGAYYMVTAALENPAALPPVAGVAPIDVSKVGAFKPLIPADALPADDAVPAKADEAVAAAPAPKLAAGANMGWTTKSIWGLPSPRKLTSKEKAALAMLGTADDTHGYEFNRVTLDDGSQIPGTPALTAAEVKEHVVGPIKKLGLADGFEAAVIDLSPHSLHHLIVQVSNTPDWTDVQAILGTPENRFEGDIYLNGPTVRERTYFRVAWFRYGWLEFGVGQGKVRAIKAEMRYADIVAAESIPGGRSAPDPTKVKRKKQQRSPTDPAAEVDALKLLGQAVEVNVARRANQKDSRLDELVRGTRRLVGKDVYPGAIETARELKKSLKVQHLAITPSANPAVSEIIELLGDPIWIKPDAGQASLKWQHYHWIDFGVEEGKVVKVRINCLMIPGIGL